MLNKVLLIAYAGADSEMKFTAAGIPRSSPCGWASREGLANACETLWRGCKVGHWD